uniref:Uncharacterized protein n=1 Tax=Plectus sambesii TaxID=2011161 RepID=A0A914XHM4_9BILA
MVAGGLLTYGGAETPDAPPPRHFCVVDVNRTSSFGTKSRHDVALPSGANWLSTAAGDSPAVPTSDSSRYTIAARPDPTMAAPGQSIVFAEPIYLAPAGKRCEARVFARCARDGPVAAREWADPRSPPKGRDSGAHLLTPRC